MAWWDRWHRPSVVARAERAPSGPAETLQRIEERHAAILRGTPFVEALVDILRGRPAERPKERTRGR